MTHREVSRPPPRHSTHHRRRNNQPRDENNSHDMPDNRSRPKHPRKLHKGDSTRLESNSASQPQTRYDIVENWLEQTARQSPHPWPGTSQGHRKVAENNCPSRPLHATSPYNKHPRHVDPRWSSRHGFPSEKLRQSASPFRGLDLEDQRKSTRRPEAPSDSSLISGFKNSTKPPDYGTGSIQQDRESTPPARPLREARLAPMDASSTTSHVEEEANFEKRPRRKTREDKYETNKKKRKHEQAGDPSRDIHRHKKRKGVEKRKYVVSSKNLVNNFSSNAVLNDRITVQPHLKPGLFDNGRVSKKQPISDLAFSKMQFLKHQKRDTQPKPLSKSRLREKQREGREIEEVSSFFLPLATNGNTRKSRTHDPRRRYDHQSLGRQGEQLPYTHGQEPPRSVLSDHCPNSERIRMSQGREETIEAPSLGPRGSINDGKESGKSTAYFTWSSSRHSPQPSRKKNGSASDVSNSVWTTTPEPIRRDLIATGIYRNTGVPLYDDHLTEQTMARTTETKMPDIRCAELEDNVRNAHKELMGLQKVRYRDQGIMTDDPTKCLEPPRDVQATREHQEPAPNLQDQPNTQKPHVPQEIDRQQIVKDIRLKLIERSDSRQPVQASNVLSTEVIAMHQSPRLGDPGVDRNLERQTQETTDQASMTSREAMPPPSVPNGRHSSIAMARTNVGETVLPRPSAPTSNIATEALEEPHTVSCNEDGQSTRAQLDNYNQTTSSSQSIMTNDHTLLSSNTASWIPRRTPSTRLMGSRSIPSRPSMKSPFYVDQYEGKPGASSCRRDLVGSQVPESMAEFIARIESESQFQSPPRDHNILDSESGIGEAALDYASFGTSLLQEQSSACNWKEKACPPLAPDPHLPYPNSGGSRVVQQYEGEFYIETQHPEYEVGIPRALPEVMQPFEDFEEERSEMSNFWRPNQFSQF
ncbi:hypothetical protein F5Y13DRAFT_178691 [Hypoxylon sp. FL1857]|nr:hypothetical protein F5Y13DRAFT_178691 [Hypoxylon sp. FL1857]